METIFNLKSLSTRTLSWIILLLVMLTFVTSLLCGTLLISLEKNSESLSLLIRHTALQQSINKSVERNVHFICKVEPLTLDPKIQQAFNNYGTLFVPTIKNTACLRKSNMIPLFISQSDFYGNYSTHYQRPESVSQLRNLLTGRRRQNYVIIPSDQFSSTGISQCQYLGLIQRFDGIEKND